MSNPIRRYQAFSCEQKTVFKAGAGLCFSAALAGGKLMLGLFTDYNLCSIAVYTAAILLAKFQCLLGIKSERRNFGRRHLLIALFLLISSVLYIGFMTRMFFIEHKIGNNGLAYVTLLAFISFAELSFAIAGLLRTQNKGYFDRYLRLINFCMALIAILTTQTSILNMNSPTGIADRANAFAGIGVGGFIALCAVYILVAPKIGVTGREHNVFVLENPQNAPVGQAGEIAIPLCRSRVYGSYIYQATVQEGLVDGFIVRRRSLWRRMHTALKVLCWILSEILVFVWLIGRAVFFLRSINLPQRLERKMRANGYAKVGEPTRPSQPESSRDLPEPANPVMD